jgi:hypothetical protein
MLEDTLRFQDLMENIGKGVDAGGVAIIVVGVIVATITALVRLVRRDLHRRRKAVRCEIPIGSGRSGGGKLLRPSAPQGTLAVGSLFVAAPFHEWKSALRRHATAPVRGATRSARYGYVSGTNITVTAVDRRET